MFGCKNKNVWAAPSRFYFNFITLFMIEDKHKLYNFNNLVR